MMNQNSFKHSDWIKIWEGKWSLLSCCHFGDEYTKEIRFGPRPFVSQSIIFIKQHRSSGWITQTDRDLLGNYLAKQVQKDSHLAKVISERLKTQAKSFLAFLDRYENTNANSKLYSEFWHRLLTYYRAHIHVKYVVDYLGPDLLKKHLPHLQAARLLAEPVLNRTEDFITSFCLLLSQETKYPTKLLLCLTKPEMQKFLIRKTLPKKSELQKRYQNSALLHDEKSFSLLVGNKTVVAKKIIGQSSKEASVKGVAAFLGKITGTARIILDPGKYQGFKSGDILVTGATRPEFLPLMEKAAGFVTDAGGILSHAAITAREMKKPCVIGTRNATQIFEDGDIIEVDANSGVVKKVK